MLAYHHPSALFTIPSNAMHDDCAICFHHVHNHFHAIQNRNSGKNGNAVCLLTRAFPAIPAARSPDKIGLAADQCSLATIPAMSPATIPAISSAISLASPPALHEPKTRKCAEIAKEDTTSIHAITASHAVR